MTTQLNNILLTESNQTRKGLHFDILSIRLQLNRKYLDGKTKTFPFNYFHMNPFMDSVSGLWYTSSLRCGAAHVRQGSTISLPHRHIITGDDDLFFFRGNYFDFIDIICGENSTYWRYSSKQNIEMGEIALDVSTCPCCIGEYFERIIDALKKRLNKS